MSTAPVHRVRSAALLMGFFASCMSMLAQSAPPPAPVFSVPAGAYAQPETLTMTDSATVAIYYTSDGSTPTIVSPQYSGPITIGVGTTTVQAIAVDSTGAQSAATSATYVVTKPQSTTGLSANPSSLVLPGGLQLTSIVNQKASGGAAPTGTVTFYSDTTNKLGIATLKLDPTTQAWTQHVSEGTPILNPVGLAAMTLSPGTQPVIVSAQTAVAGVATGAPNVALYRISPSGSTPMSAFTYTDSTLTQVDTIASGYFLQPKSTGVQSFVVHQSGRYLVFDGSTTSSANGLFLKPYSIWSYAGCDCSWDGEALAVDDFDNDGYSDLGVYISEYYFGTFTQNPYAGVAINQGAGSGAGYFNNFIQAPSPFTGNTLFCPIGIATGHFTANAGTQLAVLASSSATSCPDFTTPVAVYLYALDSTRTSLTLVGTPLTLPDLNATSITGADLNGDGITDLIIGESIPGVGDVVNGGIRTALGKGDGSFANASAVISTTSPPIGFTVNDFNGDGHADVAFTFYNSYSVLMGDGAGNLGGGFTHTYDPMINDVPGGIVSADLNGDGLPEIATLEGTRFTNNTNVDIDLNSASAKASLIPGVQALAAGTHLLTASYAGDANFAASTSQTVNELVTRTTPTVTWAGPGTSLEYGAPLSSAELNAAANVPGSFSYSPGPNTVLPPGPTTVTATFTPTDTFDYAPVVSKLSIVVSSPTLSGISPASVDVGAAATTVTVSGLGFVTGAVASYDGGALATTYVDQHHLTAVIPAKLLANPGSGTIAVTDPGGIAVVGSQAFTIIAKPLTATLSAAETSVTAGNQSTITLTVEPYPVTVTATATLTFEPAAPITVQDPNVLFANGSTTDSAIIATATTASSTPFQFQAGSTAGTITVTIHLTLANGQDVTPSNLAPVTVTVPAGPPVLSSPTVTRSGHSLQISVIALSSTRDMTEARFHFTPAAAKSIKTTDITVPLTSVFQAWYGSADSNQFGTNFKYTQPFTLDGDAGDVANVTIILVNSAGASDPATAQ